MARARGLRLDKPDIAAVRADDNHVMHRLVRGESLMTRCPVLPIGGLRQAWHSGVAQGGSSGTAMREILESRRYSAAAPGLLRSLRMLTRMQGCFALATCLSLFGCGTTVDASPAPEGCDGTVDVPDPALAAGLREQLGLDADEPIPGASLAVPELLSLDNLGIEDLSGLECATSVEQLFLDGNRIEDISILTRLPRLYNLHLDANRIVSLGALSGHQALMTLSARDNLVSSTSDLNDLPELQNLILSGNPLEALEGLDGLDGLFHLSVERTLVAELSSLSKFPALNNAYFTDTKVTSLATLPSHYSLTALHLERAEVEDASIVAALPFLEGLQLGGNRIASIAGIEPANVPRLNSLGLAGNPLTDTSPLANHPQLMVVQISDIGPSGADLGWVTGLMNLMWIEARSDSITDLSPLVGVPRVHTLDLSDNLVEDASLLNDIEFDRCARVSIAGNPGESSSGDVLDALCARNIVVEGYCLPAACDPCEHGAHCGE
ncbi:leucine-rich repeat domain-containing protein [Sorangium sp. So ce542]|uniref:leucine-rich repeat domain-containing protein n=1 Tax=Sorangium sp. So ce542 TaxID=3133316 RepID=UPI003F63943B